MRNVDEAMTDLWWRGIRSGDCLLLECGCRLTDRAWIVCRPGREMHTVWLAAGLWSCDCKAWEYRRKCPHVDAVMQHEDEERAAFLEEISDQWLAAKRS